MPAARAASSREAPSSTSARASIRREAAVSRHRLASRRSSTAPSSVRVIATVMAPPPIGHTADQPRQAPRGSRRDDASAIRPVGIIPAGRTGDGSIRRLRRSGGIVFGDAAMPAPLPIRTDHDPAGLRRLARRERDGCVSARLLALANALEGIPREEAARLAGMTGQTLGDWVHRYNAEGVEGLRDRPRPGRPCALDEGRQAALKALVLRGPSLRRDGCVAWRARDLCALVDFGVRYGETGILKLLKG